MIGARTGSSLQARLLVGQLLVILAGSLTLALVALTIAPGRSQAHVRERLGILPEDVARHLDEAFGEAVLTALGFAVGAALLRGARSVDAQARDRGVAGIEADREIAQPPEAGGGIQHRPAQVIAQREHRGSVAATAAPRNPRFLRTAALDQAPIPWPAGRPSIRATVFLGRERPPHGRAATRS